MAKSLEEVRAEQPEYSDMSDDDLFEHLYGTYYSKLPRTFVAEKMGYKFPDRGVGGDIKEVARQAAGGILVDTPRMAAQAVQAFSPEDSAPHRYAQDVIDYADGNAETFAPNTEGEEFVSGILSAGARALGPSLAAGAGFLAGPEVGVPLTATLFGGSAFDETYDKAKAAGASDFDAREAGLKTGAIQGIGESADMLLGVGPLLKLSKGILTNSAKTMGETIAKATAPDVLKPFAKALGTSFVEQGTSEVAQDIGSKAVEKSYGIDDDPRTYGEVAKDALKGTAGLTLFLGLPGLHAHFKHSQLAQEVDAALVDPGLVPKEQRLAIVESLHKGAVDAGVSDADQWLVGAKNDVDNDRPIRRTAELTTADIGEAPTVADAVEAFKATATSWETPTFKLIPDAEKIVANRNIPGVPVQQAIDAQYQPSSYVPAEQPWEKPAYDVKLTQPVGPDDSRQLPPDNAGRSDRMVAGVVDAQPSGPERDDTTQPTGELNVTNVRHDKTPIFGDPTETSHITESGYTYRNVGTKEIESILKTGYALAPEKSKGGRKGVKHWSRGDGRLFYNDSLNVIRLKDTLFKREGAIPATSLEIWDKTSNSFHNLVKIQSTDTTQPTGELNLTWAGLDEHLRKNYKPTDKIKITNDGGAATDTVGGLLKSINADQDTGSNEILKNVKIEVLRDEDPANEIQTTGISRQETSEARPADGQAQVGPVVSGTEIVRETGVESAKQPRQGVVGDKLRPKEVVKTASGRLTTPFPGFTSKTKSYGKFDNWLVENAALEAESRNDDFNARQFRADLGDKTIPQASKDSAEEYLFGTQPDVIKPFLKDLSNESTNIPRQEISSRTTRDSDRQPANTESVAGTAANREMDQSTVGVPPQSDRSGGTVGESKTQSIQSESVVESEETIQPAGTDEVGNSVPSQVLGGDFTADERAEIAAKRGVVKDIKGWARGRFGADRVKGVEFDAPVVDARQPANNTPSKPILKKPSKVPGYEHLSKQDAIARLVEYGRTFKSEKLYDVKARDKALTLQRELQDAEDGLNSGQMLPVRLQQRYEELLKNNDKAALDKQVLDNDFYRTEYSVLHGNSSSNVISEAEYNHAKALEKNDKAETNLSEGAARGRFGADRVKGVEFDAPVEKPMTYPPQSTPIVDLDEKHKNVWFHGIDKDSGKIMIDYTFKDGSKTRQDILRVSPEEFARRFVVAKDKKHAVKLNNVLKNRQTLDVGGRDVEEKRALLTEAATKESAATPVEKPSAPKPVISQKPTETKTQAKERVLKEIDEALKTAGSSQYKTELTDEETARLKEIEDEKKALGELKDSDKDNSKTQLRHALIKEQQAIHAKHIDYVTFKVSGTTYRVGNSKERLENFKRLIKAAPLSADVGTPGKSFPARQSVAEFTKDREEANAYYAAELAGISVGFGHSSAERGYVFYIDTSPVVINDAIPGTTFVGRYYSGKTDGFQWRVIVSNSGAAMGAPSKTKDAAIASAKEQVAAMIKKNGAEWVSNQVTRYVNERGKTQEQLLKLFKEKNDITDEVEPTPEPPKKEELNDFQKKSRAYWQDDVVPAFDNYLRAYRRLGADMLERNLIKPESVNATQWLESLWRQQSVWDKTRKIKQTGLQFLSQKDLWPTKIEGAGEDLRKSMIAVIKALNKSPSSNGHWLQNQEDGKDPFTEPESPPEAMVKSERTESLFDKSDISRELAYRAYSGISMTPERRAEQEQDGYAEHMQSILDKVEKYRTNDVASTAIDDAFLRYKAGYIEKVNAHLRAKSNVLSPMITGPANFPTRRNEKANNTEHRRLTELLEWDEKARQRLVATAMATRSSDEIFDERMSSIIKRIRSSLDTIKGIDDGTVRGSSRPLFVNSVVGSIKTFARNGETDIVNKALDFITEYQKDLAKPLISSKNSVWVLRDAVKEVESAPVKTGTDIVATYKGAQIVNNHDAQRVQILFDNKPSPEVRDKLKKNAFKWSPSNSAWQRQNTPNGIAAARNVLSGLYETDTERFSQSTGARSGSTVESIESLLPRRTRKVVSVVQSIRDVLDKAESFYTTAGVEGFYDPKTDKLYLVADQLTPDTILPTLHHELLHRAELTDTKLQAAMSRFEDHFVKRFNLASKGVGSTVEKAAYKRVISSETSKTYQLEEFRAYIVSEYVKEPHSIVKAVRDLIAAIRIALVRAGLDFGMVRKLTPADLFAMSKYGARAEPVDENVPTGDAVLASAKPARFYSALKRAFTSAPDKVFGNAGNVKAWVNSNNTVKKDELYWTGLTDWLDIQTGKVSRDDVLGYLDQNGVQVEDVVLGEKNSAEVGQAYRDLREVAERYDLLGFDTVTQAVRGLRNDPTSWDLSDDDLDKVTSAIAIERDKKSLPAKHNTEQLTLPGGTDYRELVVTIPTTEKFNESDLVHFGDDGKGKQIAWIRYNTRTDADGKKVLFLEEIQSQRGQEGRKKGFGADVVKIRAGLAERMDQLERDSAEWNELNAQMAESFDKYKAGSVPPAPFVTDSNNKATNAYITLLMKKAVSAAIDSGHDAVAWTTGDQQADRYDLSKQIRRVEYLPHNETLLAYDLDGKAVLDQKTPQDKVEDYIGKEVAKRLFESEPKTTGSGKKVFSVEGGDLKVGGAWTQSMYGDSSGMNAQGRPALITQAANDIARKMGGRVETIETDSTGKQPALIITPEMRSRIESEGMPLFSRRPIDFVSGRDRAVTNLSDLDTLLATGRMPQDKKTMQNFNDKAAELLVDSSRPFDVWTRKLPDQSQAGQLIFAKDRAKRRTAIFEKDALDKFLRSLAKELDAIGKKTKFEYLATKELVGQWMTVRYALEKNQDYIAQDQKAVDEAQDALSKNTASPTLKSALTKALAKQQARLDAINDPRKVDPTQEQLAVGLAGGYNDFTAKHYMAAIEEIVPKVMLERASQHVYDMLKWKLGKDLENGKVTQDMVDQWQNSPIYVPLTGDPTVDESDDPLFSTGSLNQQSDKRAVGRSNSIAQNGIDAATEQTQKSARYHGWVDFKDKFSEIYDGLIQEELDNGLTQREAQAAVSAKYDIERNPLSGVIRPSDNVIIVNKNGEGFAYSINNDDAMNALRSLNKENTPSLLRHVAWFTRQYSRMVTQFLPGFGAINAIRDTWERSENIRARTLPGYETLDMNNVASNAIKTAVDPRLIKKLMSILTEGTKAQGQIAINENDTDIKFIREMIAEGGTSTVGDYLSNNSKDLAKQLKDSLSWTTETMNLVNAWNNSFELISSYSIYKSLRESGVDKKTAASGTLNLMNFGKQGTITGPLKALYVFVNPTMQGGHQMLQTLGTKRGQTRAAAYFMAGMVLYTLLRAGADDDKLGVNMVDELGNFVLERNIPLYFNNEVIAKIPVGFGMPQLAWSSAVNTSKMIFGDQTVGDTAGEILKSFSRTIAPVQPSETSIAKHPIVWAVQTFTPQIVKPAINIGLNVNTFGSPLTSQYSKDNKAKALQGRRSTPEAYGLIAHELAKFGFDLYPEQVREIMRGYAVGPLNEIIKSWIENPHKEELGRNTVPWYIDRYVATQDLPALKERLYYRLRDEMNAASAKRSLGSTLTKREVKLADMEEVVRKLEASANGKKAASVKAKSAFKQKLYLRQSEKKREHAMNMVIELNNRE